MAWGETEALVAALEECAEVLERRGWRAPGVAGAGSLPRLRPPTFTAQLGRGAPAWGAADRGMIDTGADGPGMAQDALELAAEFRDVAQAATTGEAGRGWINSLLGRASRHLDAEYLDRVRAAAPGVR